MHEAQTDDGRKAWLEGTCATTVAAVLLHEEFKLLQHRMNGNMTWNGVKNALHLGAENSTVMDAFDGFLSGAADTSASHYVSMS